MMYIRSDISNQETTDDQPYIKEDFGAGEKSSGNQYDKGYDDSPNKSYFHTIQSTTLDVSRVLELSLAGAPGRNRTYITSSASLRPIH
jgi:hypothetical protein